MIRKMLEKILNNLGKHKVFSIDAHLTFLDILCLLSQTIVWAHRGLWRSLFFKQSKGLVLMGKGVRIRYPKYIKAGKNFIVEDYAEIMALSKQGIL